MKKIIYLHIGTHKTGTTYIQNLCGKNYDLLKSNGVLYPFQGRKPTTGHHNIGWFYSNRGLYFKDTPFSTKELIKEIESTSLDKILISTEVFSSDEFNSLHIEKIKSDLSNYEVHPVIFIRNPLYSIYSFWQEWVKHGLLHSFETCLKDENYVTQRLNSPSNIIKKWHHAFNENITIVVYDNLKANYTDVALYLLNQIIGVDIRKNDLIDFNTIVNQGLTIERAELICEINNIAGTAAWRNIDIDGNYQDLLEEAFSQKYNIHYSDYIDKNIKISKSLLKQYRKLIVNPIGENCLYHNQNCTPTFEVLPESIFKGKVTPPLRKRNHILITGTGRAGTSFLVQLLTYLGIDTGFCKETIVSELDQIGRAGLEYDIRNKNCPYVVKSPWFCDYADEVLCNKDINIEHVFIPIREIEQAAESRRFVTRNGGEKGGLWHTNSNKIGDQEIILLNQIYKLMLALSSNNIPITLVNYPELTQKPEYLFEKLKPVLKTITYPDFLQAFNITVRPNLVNDFSKPYQINIESKENKYTKELKSAVPFTQDLIKKRVNWLLTFLSLESREFNQENYQIFLKTINSIALMDPTQLNEVLQENPEIKKVTKKYLEKYQGLTVQITKKLITQKRIFLD